MTRHSTATQHRIARYQVFLHVPCPECGSPAGLRCKGRVKRDGSQNLRYAQHAARWDAYRELPLAV